MSQTTAQLSEAAGDPVPALAGIPAAPITARPAPLSSGAGPLGWARVNLFSSIPSGIVSVLLGVLVLWEAGRFLNWGILHAVWTVPHPTPGTVDTSVCREAQGTGACWALIGEKYRLILFGRYPYDEHWRPAMVVVLFFGLYAVSAMRAFWRPALLGIWVATLGVIGVLMWGGVLGMPFVSKELWGGLPITLMLATFGLAFAFPLSVLVALGRRSRELPAVKALCVVYVELIRGVPLVTLLFMASFMFPLFMPPGFNPDTLVRAQVAIILFAAAYLAEVIRGGLQALPKGQYEAADALGLSYWKKTLFIILPQALRLVIPPLVNTFIGFFKDTSLVLIIGLFDLMNTGKLAIAEQAWQPYSHEDYIFLAAIYFVICYVMARYSRGLEQELSRGVRR